MSEALQLQQIEKFPRKDKGREYRERIRDENLSVPNYRLDFHIGFTLLKPRQ